MKTLAFILLAVALCVAIAPVCAQEPPVQLPKDGNGLLEFCSHIVNFLDSPSSQLGPIGQGVVASSTELATNFFKQGWCSGYLETMPKLITFFQMRVVETIAAREGNINPSKEELEEMISKSPKMTCIPKGVTRGQIARVLVKWLRDHPERLHEDYDSLTWDALQDAFSCHAEDAKKKPGTK